MGNGASMHSRQMLLALNQREGLEEGRVGYDHIFISPHNNIVVAPMVGMSGPHITFVPMERDFSTRPTQTGPVEFRRRSFHTAVMPSGNSDRMAMLMEALVDFLEAVEGNLHRDEQAGRSLSQSRVDQLPTRLAAGGASEKECYICLSQFEEGDQVRILPCDHEFHRGCIDKWLLDVQSTCPCCRFDVSATPGDGEMKGPEEEARELAEASNRRIAEAEAHRIAAVRRAQNAGLSVAAGGAGEAVQESALRAEEIDRPGLVATEAPLARDSAQEGAAAATSIPPNSADSHSRSSTTREGIEDPVVLHLPRQLGPREESQRAALGSPPDEGADFGAPAPAMQFPPPAATRPAVFSTPPGSGTHASAAATAPLSTPAAQSAHPPASPHAAAPSPSSTPGRSRASRVRSLPSSIPRSSAKNPNPEPNKHRFLAPLSRASPAPLRKTPTPNPEHRRAHACARSLSDILAAVCLFSSTRAVRGETHSGAVALRCSHELASDTC